MLIDRERLGLEKQLLFSVVGIDMNLCLGSGPQASCAFFLRLQAGKRRIAFSEKYTSVFPAFLRQLQIADDVAVDRIKNIAEICASCAFAVDSA